MVQILITRKKAKPPQIDYPTDLDLPLTDNEDEYFDELKEELDYTFTRHPPGPSRPKIPDFYTKIHNPKLIARFGSLDQYDKFNTINYHHPTVHKFDPTTNPSPNYDNNILHHLTHQTNLQLQKPIPYLSQEDIHRHNLKKQYLKLQHNDNNLYSQNTASPPYIISTPPPT